VSPDLDLPVLMSADHIRRREFVAIRRGYDPAQVRDFLDHVADQVQEMEALLREARLEADYRQLLATLKSLFAEGADRVFDSDHVQHRLPIVLDWARGKGLPWASFQRTIAGTDPESRTRLLLEEGFEQPQFIWRTTSITFP